MKTVNFQRFHTFLVVLVFIVPSFLLNSNTTMLSPSETELIVANSIPQRISNELGSEVGEAGSSEINLPNQPAHLIASNLDKKDNFGTSVAISGDTLVVGAPFEDGDSSTESNNDAISAGAAYVFVRDGNQWMQQAYLKASNAESYDYFGASVAISGNTIVVGAWNEAGDGSVETNNDAHGAGAVYVFVREGITWTQQAYLKAANADGCDYFGTAVALSGDRIVVGAWGEDGDGTDANNNDLTDSGAAYVFFRDGMAWEQGAYLKPDDTAENDNFGYSVAISGDSIVIGAPWKDSKGGEVDIGAVYVFRRYGGTWEQGATLIPTTEECKEYFGFSVAISGDTIAVGAAFEDRDGGAEEGSDCPDMGVVYVFVKDKGTWVKQAILKPSNAEPSEYFGSSVSISGDAIIVGAGWEDGGSDDISNDDMADSGAAYVFVRNGITWIQKAHLKSSSECSCDFFGTSVAISGNTVVVGAPCEDCGGSGEKVDGALDFGAAYVFDVDQ